MFYRSLIEHTLRLPPHLLSVDLEKAITGELEDIFLDKIITNLGLCISLYDLQDIEGGFIHAGEGAPTYKVKFRMIMFRPYVGEIFSAKVKEISSDGLRLSLEFFDDIYIPAHLFPTPSCFEPPPENRWAWDFYGDILPIYETDDEVMFQVHSVIYPPLPVEQAADAKPFAPMVVTGTIDADGLGPKAWWADSPEVAIDREESTAE